MVIAEGGSVFFRGRHRLICVERRWRMSHWKSSQWSSRKKLEIVFASSAILLAGNACHTYQTLRRVNIRSRALVHRLRRFPPRLHFSGGLNSCLISTQSLFKKYGPLSGLLIELKKIISSPKWAYAWLEVQVDELDWYEILKIFLEKNWLQLMIN